MWKLCSFKGCLLFCLFIQSDQRECVIQMYYISPHVLYSLMLPMCQDGFLFCCCSFPLLYTAIMWVNIKKLNIETQKKKKKNLRKSEIIKRKLKHIM